MTTQWRPRFTPNVERFGVWSVAIAILLQQTFLASEAQPTLVGAAIALLGYPLVASRDRKGAE